MNNYVLEYLVDTAKASVVVIEKSFRQDIENPLDYASASKSAIYHARIVLNNICTSLSIDGRQWLSNDIAEERDKLISLGQDINSSNEGGEDLLDDVIGQIDEAFSKVINWLEEAME